MMIEAMRVFDGRVRLYRVAGHDDARGRLTALSLSDFPFVPRRAFWISELPSGTTTRGGHAHRTAEQLLVRLSGEIMVTLCFRGEEISIRLDDAQQVLLIGPEVWSEQTYLGPDACLFVLVNEEYDMDSYIHEKQ